MSETHTHGRDPHYSERIVDVGLPLDQASAAMIFVQSRNASARSMLELAGELGRRGS